MDTGFDSEEDTNLISAFAEALKSALDEINFPESPERISRLMSLLSLSKPQIYRITTGKAAPTLESLVKLRDLNISIDNILDQLRSSSDVTGDGSNNRGKQVNGVIEISGVLQSCLLTLAPLSTHSSIIAVLHDDRTWHVSCLAQGAVPPIDAMSVRDIHIENVRPRLAIVEDHRGTLTVLCKQLESDFNVIPFSTGTALLESPLVKQFDGYLLDWRLPDISGEELIMSIRRFSDAPIFVVTGEKSSHEIAKMVLNANIRYVVKPIDEVILAAEIMHAITVRANAGQPTMLSS